MPARFPVLLLLGALLASPSRAALTAAAGKVDITPDLKTEKVWMAGFGATGRRPRGVHDPLYARLLVVSDGKTTLGFASFDLLGLYAKDVADIRAWSGFDQPGRYLLVTATHDHSGPDTLGLWGPWIGKSGVNMKYHQRLKRAAAAELRRLLSDMKPAKLAAAETRLDPRGLCRDSRDPRVVDPYLRVLSVRRPDGSALSTLVNWSCHPEVLGPDNRLLTADYPGPLCMRVEAKTGGDCVFVSGDIGGLMTPDIKADNFYESYRVGETLADAALALSARSPAASEARIRVSTQALMIPIENTRYLLFLPGLVFGHDILDSQGRALPAWKRYWLPLKLLVFGLKETERPWVRTEVGVVDLGANARLLALPGELFPELLLGGYDGSYRAGWPLVTPGNPDPPDLSRAPKGPYLREEMNRPVKFVAGLANDELGYIVPQYDFKVRGNAAMLPRLPGHHYEETNSIGPRATGLIVETAEKLLNQK
jgi:hypothetical protein